MLTAPGWKEIIRGQVQAVYWGKWMKKPENQQQLRVFLPEKVNLGQLNWAEPVVTLMRLEDRGSLWNWDRESNCAVCNRHTRDWMRHITKECNFVGSTRLRKPWTSLRILDCGRIGCAGRSMGGQRDNKDW